jgi:hypothetical protein
VVSKSDILRAQFREIRVNKDKVVTQIQKGGSGCTRCYLGRIITQEDFEEKKKEILRRCVILGWDNLCDPRVG